jgi:hypothetical protein
MGFVLKRESVPSVDKQSGLETLVGSCRNYCQIAQHFPSPIAIGAASATADDLMAADDEA